MVIKTHEYTNGEITIFWQPELPVFVLKGLQQFLIHEENHGLI